MDDTHSGGSIHLGTTMYSVALAIAESTPEISAEAYLAAVVAGFEASARIAMAVQPQEQYALGFHPTQTCGVFGAAITASKLLGLTEEQTLAAVGITGSMAAGSMEFTRKARGPSESILDWPRKMAFRPRCWRPKALRVRDEFSRAAMVSCTHILVSQCQSDLPRAWEIPMKS